MRIRHQLAVVALVVAVPIGWSSIASAQEGEPDLDHEAEECIEILEDGGAVDDCQEAPSLILPATNEIVWGAISFAVLLVLLAKFAWPAMKSAMEDRSEKIREDIDAAERARTEAEIVKSEYESSLGDAKAEAARIIEEARQAADALKADQQVRLNEELAASRAQAQAEIDSAKSLAMAELHADVADIAIGAAEAVVGANLDRNAQTRLIEDYINRVGANGHV